MRDVRSIVLSKHQSRYHDSGHRSIQYVPRRHIAKSSVYLPSRVEKSVSYGICRRAHTGVFMFMGREGINFQTEYILLLNAQRDHSDRNDFAKLSLHLMNALRSLANVNVQKRMQQSKNVQQPQHHCNDNNGVQDFLHRGLYWYVLSPQRRCAL